MATKSRADAGPVVQSGAGLVREGVGRALAMANELESAISKRPT